MPEPEATTKGTILRSLWKFVNDDLSSDQVAKAMAELPEGDRPIIERKTLPSDKISELTLNRLTSPAEI